MKVYLVESIVFLIPIRNSEDEYSGHYVVLVDYIAAEDTFVCLNPSLSKNNGPSVRVSAKVLDWARRHAGTDQDIIICRKQATETYYS